MKKCCDNNQLHIDGRYEIHGWESCWLDEGSLSIKQIRSLRYDNTRISLNMDWLMDIFFNSKRLRV